jgi:hypothetical protein
MHSEQRGRGACVEDRGFAFCFVGEDPLESSFERVRL